MPTIAAARAAFASTAKATATPQALLVMLYDRLVLDLQRAESALESRDIAGVNRHLTHAQDIVTELDSALDPTAWDGGPGLAALYTYLLSELMGANVTKDVARIVAARGLVEPLRDAWRSASDGSSSAADPASTGTDGPDATTPVAPLSPNGPLTTTPPLRDRRLVAALGGTA